MIAILGTILIVLTLLGTIQGSTMGTLFSLINNPSQLWSSAFYQDSWATITALVAGVSVAAGLLITGKGDMAIKAPVAAILIYIAFDITALYHTLTTYGVVSSWIGLLFISPLAVLFILAVLDWWGGTN